MKTPIPTLPLLTALMLVGALTPSHLTAAPKPAEDQATREINLTGKLLLTSVSVQKRVIPFPVVRSFIILNMMNQSVAAMLGEVESCKQCRGTITLLCGKPVIKLEFRRNSELNILR